MPNETLQVWHICRICDGKNNQFRKTTEKFLRMWHQTKPETIWILCILGMCQSKKHIGLVFSLFSFDSGLCFGFTGKNFYQVKFLKNLINHLALWRVLKKSKVALTKNLTAPLQDCVGDNSMSIIRPMIFHLFVSLLHLFDRRIKNCKSFLHTGHFQFSFHTSQANISLINFDIYFLNFFLLLFMKRSYSLICTLRNWEWVLCEHFVILFS